ncbi:MAG: hypothetical protein IPQ17_05635 [Xanthomonadales bacterium]|nr:hypothetical protein [Xanthomonadales bacterium]
MMAARGRTTAERSAARPLIGTMLVFAESSCTWLIHVFAGRHRRAAVNLWPPNAENPDPRCTDRKARAHRHQEQRRTRLVKFTHLS